MFDKFLEAKICDVNYDACLKGFADEMFHKEIIRLGIVTFRDLITFYQSGKRLDTLLECPGVDTAALYTVHLWVLRVGYRELLSFINDELDVDLSKISKCSRTI